MTSSQTCSSLVSDCLPGAGYKRCCYCCFQYWVVISFLPIVFLAEYFIGSSYTIHETMGIAPLGMVFYLLLCIYPWAQCSRMMLFIALISLCTLSWTTWGVRAFLLLYHDGNSYMGYCFLRPEFQEKITDIMDAFGNRRR